AAFDKVLEVLEPSDVYYANALAAIWTEKKLAEAVAAGVTNAGIGNMGETYRKIGGKWYFWQEPGYWRGKDIHPIQIAPFFWLSRCDELIDDPDMKPGDTHTSSDGTVTLICSRAEKPVVTPSGVFDNCLVFRTTDKNWSDADTTTFIAPGIGIVEQINHFRKSKIVLKAYNISGGDGRIPFAVGNRWEYHIEKEGHLIEDEQYMEVTGVTDTLAALSFGMFARLRYDENSWLGCTLAARHGYHTEAPDSEVLVDVEKYLIGAERTAKTKREKTHTAVANKVMRRIFETDADFNPDYTEKGRWNFFGPLTVRREDDKLLLFEDDWNYSFEWKDWFWKDGKSCFDMFAVGCNFLYEIVDFALGALWSDKWIPGYEEERKFKQYDMDVSGRIRVLEDEAVETPVGSFPACRHLIADMQGGFGNWSGHTEFWYAEGVGLVKFLCTVTECGEPWRNAVWLLTAYEGEGDGYFPMEDGFFRRYEAQGLENGYHGAVEYTCVDDEQGMTLFKDALGTQDRSEYEKVK
ncbi:MAG: hypothetical protein K6A33_04570, partial [Clostridiales bacterium]|nr:hypothetical protein [Clostridiales bacterium]